MIGKDRKDDNNDKRDLRQEISRKKKGAGDN